MSNDATPRYSYPHLFRLLHWVLTGSLLILLLTGVSLHASAAPEWSVFSGKVPSWLWRGRIPLWHFWAAVVFIPCVLGALAFVGQKRFWLRPTHIILLGGGFLCIVTGLLMLFPFGPYGGLKVAVALHAAVGLVLLPIGLLWHVIGGLTKYLSLLVPSFAPFREPRWRQIALFIPLAILTTWIMFEGWPLRPPWRNLVAERIDPIDATNVDFESLPWDQAQPLDVRLVRGEAFYSGQTDLQLSALHDGNQLFVKAQWRDPSEDYNYWPWQKTEDGWEYLLTNSKDETVHYEDKFSLVFPIGPNWHFERVGCAQQCHVDGQYGWGYKAAQPDVDVWHWKSVRTGTVGQVDDKYWSVPDFESKDIGRYGDPKDGGGYTKNVTDNGEHPPWLPAEISPVFRGAMLKQEAVDYSDEAAGATEPGTLIPGVVCDPFTGDRADVRCVSKHANDQWTLYIRRDLDTGSEHDVIFVPGNVYPFGAAAFDHAAKRHAYSKPVLRLVLKP